MSTYRLRHRAAAWGAHLYTALGLPLAFVGVVALYAGNAPLFLTILWVATFIDSTDGALARRVRVKEVLPQFDGRRLADIVDYLNFVFLPALALPALGLLPPGWEAVALLPLLASGYGFSQDNAKTEESFVGFPSYWNIIVIYLFVMDANPLVTTAVITVLAVLVFVPIHYVYPNRTRFLRPVTFAIGIPWAAVFLSLCLMPEAPWAKQVALVTLVFPVYYLVASLLHHRRIHQGK
ncbi:MAG: hypothetical protein JRJ84_14080 [Deltaproteobacteria bacterium]|nr:hypothetical protein [Deltaproteobacteria bacterium]